MLLEVAARSGDATMDIEAVGRLLEALPAGQQTVGLYSGQRYALQTRLGAGSPEEALREAVIGWTATVGRLDLPRWQLARAEVMTLEEFEEERAMSTGPECLGAEDLLQRALHDPLTGLANSELFTDRVRVALDKIDGDSEQVAVLRLDLDRFGALNQAAGRTFGDHLLVDLSARLRSRFPGALAIARMGGDEFAVLLTVAADADRGRVADEVLAVLRGPVDLDGCCIAPTASLGLATATERMCPDELIHFAGLAMCAAKEAGGDCWSPYRRGVPVDARRIDIEPDVAPDRMAQVLLLQRVAAAANRHATLRDAGPAVMQEICAHTGWPLGHVSLVDAGSGRIEPGGVWHVRGPDHYEAFRAECERQQFPAGEEVTARVLATGRPASTYQLSSRRPIHPAERAPADDISSTFAFPVLVDSEVVAVLEFYSRQPQSIEASLEEVVASAGVQLGRVVERDRARAALAESERRYHRLVASAPGLVTARPSDSEPKPSPPPPAAWLGFRRRTVSQSPHGSWRWIEADLDCLAGVDSAEAIVLEPPVGSAAEIDDPLARHGERPRRRRR